MSGKAQVLILAVTALVAMLVGAASYTLYRFWPRHEAPPNVASFKPEDMETYKAAAAALRGFAANAQCDGADAKTAAQKLAELKGDVKLMAPLAGVTELQPEDYLKAHIALAFDFAQQAQDHGCLALAEQELHALAADYPDDSEVQTRTTAQLSAIKQAHHN